MKIGIVCYPTYGGSGVVATELGKALAASGNEVHFITYSQPFRLNGFKQNIRYHEVTIPEYPLFDYPPYELALTSKLMDIIQYENLDLLHVHYAIPHASAAIYARDIMKQRGLDIPVITTLHGTDITIVGKDPSFEPVISYAINQSDAVTAVSESLKQDTYEHFDVRRDIDVIPNFICMDNYKAPSKEECPSSFFAPNGEKLLTHVSNFRPVKRVIDVIDVYNEVRKKIKSKLLLIGDGPDRTIMEQRCRELGICQDVHFLGKMKSVSKVLCASDLFLLPSETESFGLSALEAMAAQTPVISSNTGGIPEVNVHGQTGFMSNVGNVQEMAENAIRLLSDETLLSEFKQNAYQRALDFSIQKILPLYMEVYDRLKVPS